MSTPELFEHPLADELLAYQRMQDKLEREHYGRWVIINGSDKVGEDYESYQDATVAAKEFGLDVLSCFIRQVGVETAIFLSYGK